MSSWFENVEEAVLSDYYQLHLLYGEDTFEQKIDLTLGVYRTNESKPWVLPVVRKAEEIISKETLDHEYIPPLGFGQFSELATKLILGEDSKAIKEDRVISSQSLSGTGALKVIADFFKKCCNADTVFISNPGFPVHELLFEHAGYKNVKTYRYWNSQKKELDFAGMMDDLNEAPKGSIVVLHACAHNPTGNDPTPDQWKQIADLIERKQLITLFDCAYQGFASGDLDKDAYAIRYFESKGLEMVVAQSFAKNLGLYKDRIGTVFFVVNNKKYLENIRSQLKTIIRSIYLTPPSDGQLIVKTILSDPELFDEWKKNLKTMASRIIELRISLRTKLEKILNTDWSHLTNQIGMFSYTGLTENQCRHLVKKYHIYLPTSGRIGMPFLNTNNIDYFAKAVGETVKEIQN